MVRFLVPVVILVCLTLFIAPTSAEESLHGELERSMLTTRNAILEGDLQNFLSSIDPINPKARITQQQWQQFLGNKRSRKLLLRGTPDLKKETEFLTLKSRNGWAAYYTQTNLDDDNYQTLSVFLFRKRENAWCPAGKSYGLTKAKPKGEAAKQGYPAWTGRKGMLKTIETDDDFSLQKLILPKSEG